VRSTRNVPYVTNRGGKERDTNACSIPLAHLYNPLIDWGGPRKKKIQNETHSRIHQSISLSKKGKKEKKKDDPRVAHRPLQNFWKPPESGEKKG